MNLRPLAFSLLALACGPTADQPSSMTSDTSTDASTSTAALPGTSAADTSVGTTSDASSEDSSTTSAADASTGGEVCVEGTFVGIYAGNFEYFELIPCDGGEPAWFTPSFPQECRSAWVTVEGALCGPGAYGHLGYYSYELRGEIVEGPCEASCGEEPSPEQCGTFDEVCAPPECRVIEQTCPLGSRCVPSSLAGTPPWFSTQCVPTAAQPQPLGAPCTRTAPWADDCDAGGYCPDVEPAVCVSVCDSDFDCADGEQCWDCDTSAAFELEHQAGVCGIEKTAC